MTLKKITSVAALVFGSLVMTISCDENNQISKPVHPSNSSQSTVSPGARLINYTFNGTEGDPITLAVASSWFLNYTSKNALTIKSHFFGATVLNKILGTSGAMGIRIYYAVDDDGNKQLLLIGADGNGNDLLPRSGAKGINSAMDLGGGTVTTLFTGTEESWVPEDASLRWIANYSTQNPQGLIAHFFGYQILNQILGQTGCVGIRMYYALNDSNIQQVLLVGVNTKGQNILPISLTGGKEADGGGTIGDASYPCPTYCSGGG